MRRALVLVALVLGCGASPGPTTTTNAPPPETPLHAFIAELCSEAARALQDTSRPIEDRMRALSAWAERPDHVDMGRVLESRAETYPGDEMSRARAFLAAEAPDVDCSAIFRLIELENAGRPHDDTPSN